MQQSTTEVANLFTMSTNRYYVDKVASLEEATSIIENELRNDIPVSIAVGDIDLVLKGDNYFEYCYGGHQMTITGITDDFDNNKAIASISSWGEKFTFSLNDAWKTNENKPTTLVYFDNNKQIKK